MTIPSDQVSPYELRFGGAGALVETPARAPDGPDSSAHGARAPPAHLTMAELAARWKRKRKTIERHYARWGLRPLRFGGRLLFPLTQVLEAEDRAMRGELEHPPQPRREEHGARKWREARRAQLLKELEELETS